MMVCLSVRQSVTHLREMRLLGWTKFHQEDESPSLEGQSRSPERIWLLNTYRLVLMLRDRHADKSSRGCERTQKCQFMVKMKSDLSPKFMYLITWKEKKMVLSSLEIILFKELKGGGMSMWGELRVLNFWVITHKFSNLLLKSSCKSSSPFCHLLHSF